MQYLNNCLYSQLDGSFTQLMLADWGYSCSTYMREEKFLHSFDRKNFEALLIEEKISIWDI
jgi:hypothetical protein